MDRPTDRQTDRQTNRQTDRQTDRQTGRQSNRQTDRKTARPKNIDIKPYSRSLKPHKKKHAVGVHDDGFTIKIWESFNI